MSEEIFDVVNERDEVIDRLPRSQVHARGEDYDQTAVRELREEIGLDLAARTATGASQPLCRLFKIDACPETDAEFVWIYRCESEGPFTLNPDEIDEGRWFAPEFVTKWIAEKPEEFATAFVLLWKKFSTTDGHR